MKKLILTALGILALASSNSNIAFANPICQSSASDPDGDGWSDQGSNLFYYTKEMN
jgi:hypothetical protein